MACAIIDSMRSRKAQLIVRNLDAEIVRRLRRRAAEHQRSMEAEHRQILRDELLTGTRRRTSLKEHLLAMPNIGRDEDFARPPDRGRNIRV
jgi:plasmid stability protein